MKSSFWKVVLPLGLVLVISGCVAIDEGGTGTTAATGDTVKLGSLLPLSGDGATYGVPARRVAELATAEINAAGGVKLPGSDAAKKLEFVFEDAGCNADVANRSAQKLLDVDKVPAILGGFCSSETLAAAPLVEKAKVVLLSPASSNPDITKAGDFVFRNYPSDSNQGKIMAQYATKAGYKKVGMIAEQQDYTLGIKGAFEDEFKKSGGEVLAETYLSDASDFKTQITKLKGEKVDIFYVNPQTPVKASLIVKQLKELEVKGPFLMNDVAINAPDLVQYKDFTEGSIGAEATYDRSNPGIAKIQAAYKAKYNEDMPYLSYMAPTYDAVYILKEAVEKVGLDSAKIRDFLYAVKDRKGLSGSLTFDSNGDPVSGFVLRVLKAGKVEDYTEAAAPAAATPAADAPKTETK